MVLFLFKVHWHCKKEKYKKTEKDKYAYRQTPRINTDKTDIQSDRSTDKHTAIPSNFH